MERIVVAFSHEEAQRRILRLLESAGCPPAACCSSGGETIRTVRKLGGAVVVCGFKFRDMTASEVAASLRDTAVLLVLASAAHLDFCEGENLFKLPTPAARSDFFASLDMLCRQEARHPRRAPPQRDEEEVRLIRRAKELLMEVNRMSEAEAHRFLQKRSMDAGLKLAETARLVLEHYAG